ncbi:zinc ABC transporter substrate-binding protein AztC [Nonomuraea glycinis]|uniref:zinc ABC transporter substrate-binding protein AztC n=1 Tax=Nonomuraea glycinis TaxID=2047744 RepID=UPI0033A4BA41
MRILLIVLAMLLAGCASGGERRPEVVVTTDILGDVTRLIVGDQAEVTVLMKPGSDPHSFGVSAQQAARLERAALVVYNGLGLEEGVLRNVQAARESGVATLAAVEAADPLRPDPHFWTDPRRMAMAVDAIAGAVERIDGVDPAAIRANAAAYRREIERLDAWMEQRLGAIPPAGRELVTNHHVFGYFAQRYGFTIVGTVIPGGTTLASPSASDLKELADAIREHEVPAIFTDSAQPDRLAQVLASEAGVEVQVVALFTESLSGPGQGADTYLRMMRANTDAMVDGLGTTP